MSLFKMNLILMIKQNKNEQTKPKQPNKKYKIIKIDE